MKCLDEHKQHCKLLQNSNNDRLQQAQQKLQVSETKSEKLLSQLAGAQQKMKEIEMRHVQQTESVRIDLQQARDQSELLLQQIQSKESEMKELQNEQRRLQQLLQSRLKAIAQAEDKALKSESRANQAEEQLKLFDELKSDRDLLQSQLTTSRDQFNKANRQITELSASVKRLLDERNQALLHLQQIQSILIQLPAAAAAAANKSGIHSGEKQGSGSGGTWNTEQSQMINSLDSPDSKQANKMMENHYSTENPTNSLDMDRLLLQILNGSSLGDVEPDTHNEFACCRPDENQLNGSIDSISESYQNLDLNALSIKKHKKSGGKKEGKRGLSKFGLSDKKLKFNFL